MKCLICCLLLVFSDAVFAAKPAIQLAKIYHSDAEVGEFLVSEKLDGVRGYFDGEKLISRQGNIINAPKWFIADFPKEVMDGELWIARGKFELVSQIIRKQSPDDKAWQDVRFMIFDLPNNREVFSKRFQAMKMLVAQAKTKYLQVIDQIEVTNNRDLQNLLQSTVEGGGEGLMLHRKNAFYRVERNEDLLKLKTFNDAEGTVIAHIAGQGKFQNQLGALLVTTKNAHEKTIKLKIGSGFSDEQRLNPPAIGSEITYKFSGYTNSGTPRFVRFWREKIAE